MTRSLNLAHAARAAAACGLVLSLAACEEDPDVVQPPTPAGGSAELMRSYVALGNSITAGYQSGGINDSTQRQSYARILAAAAGTRYAYPALTAPGCPAPIANFVLQTRVGGAAAGACALRTPGSANAVLNNVAVPGANSFDPTGLAGGGYTALTTFVLGGKTQVQRAIDADPSFASVWIGNNDVLSFAVSGTTTGITPVATFTQNYAAMIAQLRAGAPNLKGGVLIGVVDVTLTPILIPIAAFAGSSPQSVALRTAIQTQFFGGRQIQFVPNTGCSETTTALIAFPAFQSLGTLAASLPAGQPVPFACQPTPIPGLPVPLGAAGILDAAERASVATTVTAYNAYIRAKADSIGFAYYDPNPRLATLRVSGAIPAFPNLAAPTQPFGQYISNDGVHPAAAAHLLIAQDLVAAINGKFGVQIPAPTAIPQ